MVEIAALKAQLADLNQRDEARRPFKDSQEVNIEELEVEQLKEQLAKEKEDCRELKLLVGTMKQVSEGECHPQRLMSYTRTRVF